MILTFLFGEMLSFHWLPYRSCWLRKCWVTTELSSMPQIVYAWQRFGDVLFLPSTHRQTGSQLAPNGPITMLTTIIDKRLKRACSQQKRRQQQRQERGRRTQLSQHTHWLNISFYASSSDQHFIFFCFEVKTKQWTHPANPTSTPNLMSVRVCVNVSTFNICSKHVHHS